METNNNSSGSYSEEGLFQESYLLNYFFNKVKLARISSNPEIGRKNMLALIKILKKNYIKLGKTDRVKKVRKSKDVGCYLYPAASFTFPDKMEVTVYICFDDSSFTPGAASYNKEIGYHIIVYPGFFTDTEDQAIFTLLHEFGHIRLGHCRGYNAHRNIFGKEDYSEHRVRTMAKGEVIYPESNADLYAVLNGADMYAILGMYTPMDHDDKYDYRYSNAEAAARYKDVFKRYGKLRGFREGVELYLGEDESPVTETHMDTLVTRPEVYFNKKFKLYHFSNSKKDIVVPITVNAGNKLAKPRFSSWWTPQKSQIAWALANQLFEKFPECKWKNVTWAVSDFDQDGLKYKAFKTIISESFFKKHEDFIKSIDIYMHEKTFNGKDLGRGNEYSVDEFTCDFAVKPDKVTRVSWDEIMDYIKIVPDEEMPEYIKVFNDIRLHDKNWQDLIHQKKEWLYWEFDTSNEIRRKYCKDHNIEWSVDEEYFRFTYKGKGIYEALKEKVDPETWKKFLRSSMFTWLPKPEQYPKGCISYFTKEGRRLFTKRVLPICERYLGEDIEFSKVKNLTNIVYKDKYQVIVDTSITESAYDDISNELLDFIVEATGDSHFIIEGIYPKVSEVLKTPVGDKEFKRAVENFIDRNSEKLHEPCPISMIAFTDGDKNRFYDIFNVTEKELKEIVSKGVSAVSSQANFKLVNQNPIFSLFYCVLRYYILKNDEQGINATLVIHALASYPSVFSKYFKYGANAGVMRYTADHLTEKFIFKQEGHVFGALRASIYSSYKFLKPYFKDGSDKEVVRYIQRIRNDQNSMIKKIANEYNKNYVAGNTMTTQNETYGTGSLIDDAVNDTSKVETIGQAVIISILTNGINLNLLNTAAAMSQLSIVELRLYLTQILTDKRSTELEDFINAVLFVYLYDEKHPVNEIKSKTFLSFGIELFRRTNSNNKNIATIKRLLDKWAEETGIHSRFKREGTRISYKKGIYWYIMLTIQAAA
jgi:hypothetical protein